MAANSPSLKVTARGQVTFRRAVLEHLGAKPGDRLVVALLPGGRAEVRAAPREGVEALFGMLDRPDGISLSIEEMNDIIAAGWAGEV